MRHRRLVRLVGLVQRKDIGRPETVYGRPCKQREMEHEVRVTEFALLMKQLKMRRGVKVGRTEPDGVFEIDGRTCYLELDNSGKLTAKQMRGKWRRYPEGLDGFILVVARSEKRMQRLRAGAELVKESALFTTFDRLRKGGASWVDFDGNAMKL